jgi:hypothetical protein
MSLFLVVLFGLEMIPFFSNRNDTLKLNEAFNNIELASFDRELLPLIVHSTRALSRVVNAEYGHLVLMPNATTATNIVARNAGISAGKNVRNIDFKTSVIRRYVLSLQAKCSMCHIFTYVSSPPQNRW